MININNINNFINTSEDMEIVFNFLQDNYNDLDEQFHINIIKNVLKKLYNKNNISNTINKEINNNY